MVCSQDVRLDAVELVGFLEEGPGKVEDFESQARIGGAAKQVNQCGCVGLKSRQ